MFDVTSKITYKNVPKWYKGLINVCDQGIPIVVVGNKVDIRERKVKPKILLQHFKSILSFLSNLPITRLINLHHVKGNLVKWAGNENHVYIGHGSLWHLMSSWKMKSRLTNLLTTSILFWRCGRRKHKTVIIVGESNCAKTFPLEPLNSIFPVVFHTSAESRFGWMDVEKANIIFLNDFRWKPSEPRYEVAQLDGIQCPYTGGAQCKLPLPFYKERGRKRAANTAASWWKCYDGQSHRHPLFGFQVCYFLVSRMNWHHRDQHYLTRIWFLTFPQIIPSLLLLI